MASIRFDKVQKRFGDTMVVHDLDLLIEDEEFFTFVGPSGCGKSTVLNLIAGLEPISTGALYFEEREVSALSAGERDVAMVFQSYALYPHMNVYENIAFPLRVRKEDKASIDAKVREVAQTLDLAELLQRKPAQLSGGQRQRVALGRALVRRPVVFLMDEPLSNLDARLRVETRAELKRLHGRYRITTVYVTHDQEEAMALSDRIAVLDRGVVQQCGAPLEVYHKPSNIFVAGFIGSPSMNFLDGALLQDVGWARPLLERTGGREAVVGIRPGDMVVGEGSESSLEAEVTLLEPTGSDVWVDGIYKGVPIKGRLAEGATVKPGETARFQIPTGKCHVFEKEGGTRIG
jgi:multiple sugar transport system ATP-binding protein